jgi:hypothetical protein
MPMEGMTSVPTRDFRMFLYNQTPWRLARAGVDLHQGAWTEPWQPPEFIQPGGQASWWSESDGPLEGTEGRVSYVILDTESYVAGDHFGFGDALEISWYNPYLGKLNVDPPPHTSLARRFFVKGQVAGGPGEFAGEGSVASETAHDYKADTAGPRTQGEQLTPFGSDGWVEVIPGIFALPLPTGIIDHAMGEVLLRFTPHTLRGGVAQTDFEPGLGPASPHTVEPVVDSPVNAWQGTWTNGSQGVDVTVTINAANDGRFAVAVEDKNLPTPSLDEVVQLLRVRPDTKPKFPVRHAHPIADASEQGRFATHRVGGPLVPPGALKEHAVGIDTGERAFQPTADTLNLPEGVQLELNGSYDGKHNLDGYRLHYRRVADGAVVADLMLIKEAHIR